MWRGLYRKLSEHGTKVIDASVIVETEKQRIFIHRVPVSGELRAIWGGRGLLRTKLNVVPCFKRAITGRTRWTLVERNLW